MCGHSARNFVDWSGNDLMSQKVTPHEKRVYWRSDPIFGLQAPRTPLGRKMRTPEQELIDCPSGVEGGTMYTDVGCNVYFDF